MKNQKGKFQKPYIVVMIGFLSLGYSWCLLSSGFACPPPPNDPPPPPPCTAACCTNDGGPSGNEGNNDSPIQKFGGVSGGLSADNLGPVVKFNTRESGGGGRNDKPGMSVIGGDGSGGPGGGAGGGGTSCPSCTSASGLDPVFMSTGEFQYALTDVYIPGPIPVEITRNYGNKRNNSTSFYGYNWTTNYDMRIREISSSVLSLTNAKGCASEYTLVSSNPNTYAYNGDASKYIIETSNPNGYDVIYKETGLTYHFLKEPSLLELNGRLKYIKDKYSNQITFDLSSSTGKITGITDCFGRYITFTYSTTAPYNLSQIQDFSGRQWQYIYTSGNLSRVRFPATPDCTSGLEYQYTYDDNHNLTDVHVKFNNYTFCIVKNYYNTSNKVYQQIRYMGEIWEPRNNTSTVYYNTQAKTATIYDGEHHKKTITYNNAGMKSEETVYTDNTQENPNHFTTQYIYDSLNRLSRIVYPAGNCEEYTYNSEGFLEGIYKKTSASVLNNPSSPDVIATLYTYCSSSNPALYSKVETITDALGNVTEYEYFTDTGYLKKVTGPEITTPSGPRQASVEYTYTAAGMVDTITDPNGIVTKYVYYQTLDYNNGLLWKVIQDYGVGQQYLNLTTTYTYDELRRVLTVTNPKNAVTTYAYNAFNQVTQITSPSPFNYVTKYSYHFSGKPSKIERQTSDPANPWQITEMTYNNLGQILAVKDALNKTTTYTYDQNERRSSVKDALNQEIKYEYDERGLLVKVTDPNDDDTLYAYDLNGNRTSVTDSNGNTTSYEYDSFDRLVKVIDAEGHYRTKILDKKGRVVKEVAYDRKDINNLTDDIALMQTRYEYNAAGDLIRRAIMADASAADTTAIDTSIDNVVDYTFYWGNGPRAQEKKYYANGSNAITYKSYDRLHRLRLQVDPSLNSTQYVYDSTDNVLRIQKVDKNPISGGADLVQTTDFIYDELGRRTYQIEKPQNPDAQSDSSWQTTQYVYDALDNSIQEIRPNGVIVLYGYDLLGRKISMVVDPIDTNNPNGINQITEYGYDDIGRQITIAGYADNTNPATKQTTGYEYDNEGRVVQITYPDNATIQYAYTSIGKVWRRTDPRGIQTYYTYDDAYNMIQKTATIGSVTTTENFTYDGLGRMLTAQKLEGGNQISLSEFEYNDKGRISDTWETIFNLQEKQIQYAYDNAGYPVQTIYPNTVQIDRTNDWQGRIDTLTKGTATFIDYAYMGNKVVERKSGSYIYFRPEYDNLGRLTRAYTYRDITNVTLADFSYMFAANENNIETMSIDHRPNQPYNAFSYDNLDRITDVAYLSNQNDVESFPMDDLGNRTGNVTQRDGVHNYSVDALTNRYSGIDTVAHWKLDEQENVIAVDSSGNGHNGTLTNDPVWSPEGGVINGALELNGINTYVVCGSSWNITDFGGASGAVTIAAWVHPDAVNRYNCITRNIGGVHYFSAGGSDSKARCMVRDVVHNINSFPSSNSTLSANAWTHVVFVLEGGVGYKFYINGVLDKNQSDPNLGLYNYGSAGYLGHGYDAVNGFFDGKMDNVMVLNKAMTPEQVASLYLSQNGDYMQYDAAGNLIADKDGYRYIYDYENRVTRIFKMDDQTEVTVAQYAYDALGRRIWKNDPLATQPNVYYYYNDQWQILCEYTGTDSCLQWFTYGNYIDEVLSRNTSTTAMLLIQYYIQDHLYNVVALANIGGTVVERYEYDVYGNPTIINRGTDQAWYTTDDITHTASAYNNLFNFTGRQLDVLNGGALKYMHYRHRDYSPFMGRFMQQDPLGLSMGKRRFDKYVPLMQYYSGLNLYEYVRSEPVNKSDFSGLVCGPGNGIGDWIVPDAPWIFGIGGADFTDACQLHDDCYGGQYGCENSWPAIDKESCDKAFKRMMKYACSEKYGDPPRGPIEAWGLASCESAADLYYDAVSKHGDDSYKQARNGPPCNCP